MKVYFELNINKMPIFC